MLRSLTAATPVVNSRPIRRRDYSVELQRSGPAMLPAIYKNLHIVGLVLSDGVVVRETRAGTQRTRLARGESYICPTGPGERVTWPLGMHALYVHLHPRLIRRLGEGLLGTPGLGLQSRAVLRDLVLRDIAVALERLVTAVPVDLRAAEDLVMAIAHHVVVNYAATERPAPSIGALSVETILDEFRDSVATWDSVSTLADRCGVSRAHFTRRVRRLTGLSPYHMVLGSRIEAAKHMLERREASLSEIAYTTGFVDQSHLTRVFRRFTGVTPGHYGR